MSMVKSGPNCTIKRPIRTSTYTLGNHPLEHKRGVVKSIMHRVGNIVSNAERDKVEEKSHVKQALTMDGYPELLISSIQTIQHSVESTASASSDDTSDDVRVTENETTNKKPTS